ncbi:MAG: ORF6N domain-containing protein [Bacteroidales bacterium]|nr:ORF6N domain-containing protein [Bacteroidales bacterium]MDY6347978.1 ORF6N domain-containing protein [Bacteroidales bacterium]
MNSENANNFEDLNKLIYIVRGVKVMLDADLASIYGYTTKTFNQQVKNNIEKFDADFRFQLTKNEYEEILRSKILTSNVLSTNCESIKSDNQLSLRSKKLTSNAGKKGGRQYLPYVFTEQGIYMLMTVLKGELATEQSKVLIRTFKGMKDLIVENRYLIGNKDLVQLSIQTTQNTADISKIKSTMVTKNDLAKVVSDFTDPMTRREYLILNGDSVEANIAYSNIYKSAKSSVFVIDNYIGLKTLVLLKNVLDNIPITVFSDNTGKGFHQTDYNDFHKEYPNIQINFRQTLGIFHDRYIILDYNTDSERIFHCGASSKDAGNKVTTITEVADRQVYHQIVDTLLNNPVLLF